MWKKASMPNTSSIRPAVSIQYRLVTDRQPEDGHTTTAYTALTQRRALKILYFQYAKQGPNAGNSGVAEFRVQCVRKCGLMHFRSRSSTPMVAIDSQCVTSY